MAVNWETVFINVEQTVSLPHDLVTPETAVKHNHQDVWSDG